MDKHPVSVFGLQTGVELLGRIRHTHPNAVPTHLARLVNDQQMSITATVRLLEQADLPVRFIESFSYNEPPYEDDHQYDTACGNPLADLYVAVLSSNVQPASYVTLRLSGDVVRAFTDDLVASGLYRLMYVFRADTYVERVVL